MSSNADDPNTPQAWERYFEAHWERRRGRRQTRLFAKYWLETVPIPPDARTLLDVGCAMGDAAPEIHQRYPHLKITGCDVSVLALAKAKESYGSLVTFEQWGFDDIRGQFDLIYCSNTLEHFVDYVDIAAKLLGHCKWLYVLVPYNELRRGKPLQPEPGEQHVATFHESSFDELVRRGRASSIRHWLHPCPIAWTYIHGLDAGALPDPPPRPALWKKLLRPVLGPLVRPVRRLFAQPTLEIFYEIRRSA